MNQTSPLSEMITHLYTSKYSLNSKKADQCLQTYVNTSVYFNISHLITSLNYICIQTQKDIKINIYLTITRVTALFQMIYVHMGDEDEGMIS
jgi:hypothetical protein